MRKEEGEKKRRPIRKKLTSDDILRQMIDKIDMEMNRKYPNLKRPVN